MLLQVVERSVAGVLRVTPLSVSVAAGRQRRQEIAGAHLRDGRKFSFRAVLLAIPIDDGVDELFV